MSILYASCININKTPDLIVYDECHHILSSKTAQLFNLDRSTKFIFFSATLPVNCDFDFGQLAFKYSYNDAINNNVCKDFDIIVDLLADDDNSSVYNSIVKHSLTTNNLRILTFHNTVAKSPLSVNTLVTDKNIIKNMFIDIGKKQFSVEIKDVFVDLIVSDTKNKSDLLNSFENAPTDTPYVLASCRSIGEGIDLKNANCICFCEPKNSVIDIVQNIGRISRNVNRQTNYNKPIIILPITSGENYESILNVVSSLKNNCDISIFSNNKYHKTDSNNVVELANKIKTSVNCPIKESIDANINNGINNDNVMINKYPVIQVNKFTPKTIPITTSNVSHNQMSKVNIATIEPTQCVNSAELSSKIPKTNKLLKSPYICPKCKKKFNKKSVYDNHLKNRKPCDRNLIKITEDDIHNYVTDDFTCTVCNMSFLNKYNATRHIRNFCKKVVIIKNIINPLPIEQNIVGLGDTDIKNLLTGINNTNTTDDIKKLLGAMNVALTALLDNKNKDNPIKIKNTNNTNNINNNDNSIDNSTNNTINIQVNNPIIYPYGDEYQISEHYETN